MDRILERTPLLVRPQQEDEEGQGTGSDHVRFVALTTTSLGKVFH